MIITDIMVEMWEELYILKSSDDFLSLIDNWQIATDSDTKVTSGGRKSRQMVSGMIT